MSEFVTVRRADIFAAITDLRELVNTPRRWRAPSFVVADIEGAIEKLEGAMSPEKTKESNDE